MEYKQCYQVDGSVIGTTNNTLIGRCSGKWSYKWIGMMSSRIRAWIGLGGEERVWYDDGVITPRGCLCRS